MMDLEKALRDWFYERASVPHWSYGMDREATDELKKHLEGCQITWNSEPDLDAREMRGEYDQDRTVCGIEALVSCGCGRFRCATLFMTYTTSLTNMMDQVTAAALAEKDGK